MGISKMRRSFLAAVASVALCSGCASFRSGALGDVELPTPAAQKKSVSISFTGDAVVSGEVRDAPQQMLDLWRERTWAAYQDSGIFSDVKTGAAATDLRAEVHIRDQGDPNIALAVVSGLTLTLVPAVARDELVMQTTFKDADGNTLATIEKSETVSTWIELFMVFVMPAKFPAGVVKATINDLNYATLAEARARHLL